jgi:hypothetical protein
VFCGGLWWLGVIYWVPCGELGSSESVGKWTAWGRCCGVGESDG